MLTAIRSRWRNLTMLVAVLSVLGGGMALATPAASAHPEVQLCAYTHAVGIGYKMAYVAGGSIYATLDKKVDNTTGQYCGQMRVHAQSRNIAYGHNYYLQGNLYYSSCSLCTQHGQQAQLGLITPNSSGVYDLWGAWQSTPCARVIAYLDQGTSTTIGQTQPYPGGSSVVCP